MTRTAREIHPILSSSFWIEIDGVTEAVFRECSGLSVETVVQEYQEGGLNTFVHKLPGQTKYSDITLKRGWLNSDELWKWYAKIISGQIERRAVSIILSKYTGTNPGQEVCRWNLQRAIPIKWQGPDLQSDSNSVGVETLVLAHEGWEVVFSS